MSDTEIDLLRRKLTEIEELAQQACAMASLANQRNSELRAEVAALRQRIDGLKVEAKTIAELIG